MTCTTTHTDPLFAAFVGFTVACACEGAPVDASRDPREVESAPSGLENASNAGSDARAITPLAVFQSDLRQSVLALDPDDADGCPVVLFIHVGEENKPLPLMIGHGTICAPSTYMEQRALGLSNNSYGFPEYVMMSEDVLDDLRLVVSDHVSFQKAMKPKEYEGRSGGMGTFLIVFSGNDLVFGKAHAEHACHLFAEIGAFFPEHQLRHQALRYRQILGCDGFGRPSQPAEDHVP